MGIFSRQRKVVDTELADPEWFAASRDLFRSQIEGFYGSPETIASGGQEHYQLNDYGTAMLFYAKSIDMLHSAYGFAEMKRRHPSLADGPIIDGFNASLADSLRLHPQAPVAECVREVTHRLRSISSECDRLGFPADLYLTALDAMSSAAPHVPVDDIQWT